jgi:hypothetical protein
MRVPVLEKIGRTDVGVDRGSLPVELKTSGVITRAKSVSVAEMRIDRGTPERERLLAVMADQFFAERGVTSLQVVDVRTAA